MSALRIGLACLVAIGATSGAVSADEMLVPATKVVIYPGDIVGDDALEDVPLSRAGMGGPFALSRIDVVGKTARRTLLPGRAIPLAAVDNPRLIRNGAEVTMVYIEGALTITTTGAALQDGALGETVKVRNTDSGVTIHGQVRADGSILVGEGG